MDIVNFGTFQLGLKKAEFQATFSYLLLLVKYSSLKIITKKKKDKKFLYLHLGFLKAKAFCPAPLSSNIPPCCT